MSDDVTIDLGGADAPNAASTPAQSTTPADTSASAVGSAAAAPRSIMVDGVAMDVPEQYWDAKANAPNVGALLKSTADMRQKLSARAAPETYTLTADADYADYLTLDPQDPLVGEAMGILKDGGVSQETASKLVNWMARREASFVQADQSQQAAAEQARAGFVQAMGGDAKVADFNRWLTEISGGQTIRTTPEGALALAKFRASLGEVSPPSGRDPAAPAKTPTADDLKTMMADPRYYSDPSYRAQVSQAYERVYGNDPAPGGR